MNSSILLEKSIVSVKWLHENLQAENLVVLDGTINKTFDSSLKQIPGTRFFDIKNNFSDTSGEFPSTFPSQQQFEKEARNLGVNNKSAIVVYDDKGIYSSARVWWMFKAFGFNNVAVLDGGFPEWLNMGYPLETMVKYSGEKGDFQADFQSETMKFYNDMKKASNNKTFTIVDARSSARFNCEVPEPRVGLRRGRIPNSVNLPYTHLLTEGVFKSRKELEETIEKIITTKNERVIFSCGSGITACILALGAEISGYENIAVYDGSWTEWGTLNMES